MWRFLLLVSLWLVPMIAHAQVLTPDEARSLAERGELTIIDVRLPVEWQRTGLPEGALAISLQDGTLQPRAEFVADVLEALANDPTKPVALICASGYRSAFAQLLLEQRVARDPIRQPSRRRTERAAGACDDAEGIEPAIVPRAAERGGEVGMQGEAAPGQRRQRRAIAPVQRQEAAGLARGGAGDAGPLDDHGLHLPPAQEVGGTGADHAAAADQNTHDPPSITPA